MNINTHSSSQSRFWRWRLRARLYAQGADSKYQVVENWAQFPPGITAWGGATGVDIDPKGNIYVFHRNESMPIMAFDKNGKFLRAWGQGMFKTTHFLRTDQEGNVWVTDRGDHQVFKFSPEGKLLMTLGRKGVDRRKRIAATRSTAWPISSSRKTATSSLPTARAPTRAW